MFVRRRVLIATLVFAAACDRRQPADPNTEALFGPGGLPPVAVAGGPYVGSDAVTFDGRRSFDPDGPPPLSFRWDFGDGTTGTGPTPSHRYGVAGNYRVRLTVTDGAGRLGVPSTTVATILRGTGTATLAGAGNITGCGADEDNATAALLDQIPGVVVALGDNVMSGTLEDYRNCYDPSWGRHKDRTYAVLGNHEYDPGTADGAFDYFGARVGPRGRGYYSFDLGAWHVVVLNDNDAHVPYAAGSEQDQWLRDDLARTTQRCVLAMWHQPYFLSSNTAGFTVRPTRRTLWERLHAAGADVVLNGHQHHYERFAPMRPDGTRDDVNGIRQFNVGTGGESVALPTVTVHPNSELRSDRYGVLKLTLEPTGYRWEFLAADGSGALDGGTASCR